MKTFHITSWVACCSLLFSAASDIASAEHNARIVNAKFRNLQQEDTTGDAEDFSVPIISVRTKGPKSVESDEPATYQIKVRNISSKKDASVNVLIKYSAEAGYINANPVPEMQREGELEYNILNLARLTDQDFTLTLLPPKAGSMNVEVTCKLEADNKLATVVKRPSLRFDVNSPPFGRIGEKIPFEFTVINSGDGIVRDIHVFPDLPEGLTLDEESSNTLAEAFSIEAGKTRNVKVNLMGHAAGIHDVRFRLLMGNHSTQNLQTELCITQPTTDLHFVGPAQHVVGEKGDYSLILENNNQNPIENAELDLEIPAGLNVEKVSRYADFFRDERGAMHLRWPIRKIEPGRRMVIRLRAIGLMRMQSDCKIEVYFDNDTKKVSHYSVDVIDQGTSAPIETAGVVDLSNDSQEGHTSVIPRAKLNR